MDIYSRCNGDTDCSLPVFGWYCRSDEDNEYEYFIASRTKQAVPPLKHLLQMITRWWDDGYSLLFIDISMISMASGVHSQWWRMRTSVIYLNQWWFISMVWNKFRWHVNQNCLLSKYVWKCQQMAAFSYRSQCVSIHIIISNNLFTYRMILEYWHGACFSYSQPTI